MLVVGNSDRQVGRAPEHIHQGKRDDHLQTVIAIGGHEAEISLGGLKLKRFARGVSVLCG